MHSLGFKECNMTMVSIIRILLHPLFFLQEDGLIVLTLKPIAVFIEVFPTTHLFAKESGQLYCSVKASTDAVVTVWHDAVLLDQPYNALTFSENCDHSPRISRSSVVLDDQFSLFSITIHVSQLGWGWRKGRCKMLFVSETDLSGK